MSYQVIARKYRPQRFGDVVGQDHVTTTLAHAVEQGRIAHAYLFCGPRGTGKTTIARIFAKCLNCTGGPKVDFEETDPKCAEIAEGRSLDVLEIDGASNNGVEQVRELRETCKFAPASSRFKIYIIDEVHMLSTAAFNALLKTLEEPPPHVKFLFATTDPEKVLPTILSRCQRFDLQRIPVALIVRHLAKIAKLEKVQVEDAALHAIARGAEGGLRDAESALDQLISFCGEQIVEGDVLSMFGLAAQGQILSLASAVLTGGAETVLRELNDLARHGKDLGRLLSDLLNQFRNLLIYHVSGGDWKLLEVSEPERDSLVQQSKLADVEALTRIMEVLADAEGRFRDAASKKIFLEVTLLRAMQARQAVSLDAVLQQLARLRAGGADAPASRVTASAPAPARAPSTVPDRSGSGAASGVAASSPASAPAPAQTATTAASGEGDLAALWASLLERVGRASAFTRSYLVQAHPVSFSKGVFTIGFDPEFADQLELVNNSKTHTLLQTKLQELGHPNAQFKFIQAEAPLPAPAVPSADAPQAPAPAPNGPASGPSPAAAGPAKPARAGKVSAEDFKDDPLIQKALEIFRGQIANLPA
jgi:DNA polymerase-3 subunit gamma/tau